MKQTRRVGFIVLCALLFFGTTGCYVTNKKDNGNHKGWFKNTNNPHHPKSKKNKGKSHKSTQQSNQSFNFPDHKGPARLDVCIGIEMTNQ